MLACAIDRSRAVLHLSRSLPERSSTTCSCKHEELRHLSERSGSASALLTNREVEK